MINVLVKFYTQIPCITTLMKYTNIKGDYKSKTYLLFYLRPEFQPFHAGSYTQEQPLVKVSDFSSYYNYIS